MRENIVRTNGAIFSVRVVMTAGPRACTDEAQAMVKAAIDASRREGVGFAAALRKLPDVSGLLTAEDLRTIDVPEEYLGAAEELRIALLNEGR
jgi:adenylosuccinate lyase